MTVLDQPKAGATVTGIVTRHDGPRFWVDLPDGSALPCTLRGRLRRERERVSSIVVVGDCVEVLQADASAGTIESIRPRRSELTRPGFKGLEHIIAANLDLLVIVQSAANPPFQARLVERFVVAARRGRMEALLVVNKCDLESESVIRAQVETLKSSAMPMLLVSALNGRGIEELRAALQGRASVLAGKSGVGKSSLLNALYPDLSIRTSAVSAATDKGRHTTTAACLYPLPGGGYLADTPGIRTLGLYEDEDALAETFPEIEAAAVRCRFRNCAHRAEPGCAVRSAVQRGAIRRDRYDHFLRLAAGD